ncbi:hypothetical protein INT45_012245 [Circinella minor]|uniref:Zn(2)-C6 fungal-type domain-containing protein n=1 Tax=Circinella minor TaxID=1195481 RepID=A0A8H7S2V5_9FUNG|nr:hypothetical protein INT45_012245 [Circinella minor]
MEQLISASHQQTLQKQRIPRLKTAFTIAKNPKGKAHRNSKSCDNCRKRKVRCNSNVEKPCTYCKKDNIECQFFSNRKKMGPPSKCYTESLEKRVHMLEELLDEERKKNQKNDNMTLGTDTFDSSNTSGVTLELERQEAELTQDVFLLPQPPSSTIIQLSQLHHNTTTVENTYCQSLYLVHEVPDLTLELAERMIEGFFYNSDTGSQVINIHDFLTQFYYQYPRPLDRYLFWAVCATGCHYLPAQSYLSDHMAISIAGRYMKKKCMGAMKHYYTKSNITTIQTLILLSALAPGLESTEGASANWLILGAAIRMCQDWELFYDANLQHLSKTEIQLRRRIAYIVYILDKFFSATCGKPFTIRDDDFNVELPLVYDIEPDNIFKLNTFTNGQLPVLLERAQKNINEKQPIYSDFLDIIFVSRLVGRILTLFYMPKTITNIGVNMGFEVDSSLIEWQTKREANVSSNNKAIDQLLYSGILLLRYLPATAKITTKENGDEQHLLNLCTIAANNIVDSLDSLPVPIIPSITDGLISLARVAFLQICDRTNDDYNSQARINLRRCLNICMRNEIAVPSQNSIAIKKLINK